MDFHFNGDDAEFTYGALIFAAEKYEELSQTVLPDHLSAQFKWQAERARRIAAEIEAAE